MGLFLTRLGKFESADEKQMIGRRRFVQVVIAGTATAAIGNLAKKSFAQQVPLLIYGVSAVSGRLLLQSLDLTSGQLQDLSASTFGITLLPDERLSGFTLLPDGTFVLATAPATPIITGELVNLSRLIFLQTSPQILSPLPELDQNSTIESLLGTNDGELLSIVSLNQGTPPFRLACIDRQTGEVSFINELSLPPQRFSNLTQCPDGHIYATSLGREGSTSLVQLNLQQGNLITLSQLSFNGRPLENDLASLAYSPSNQLFALGDPTYEGTNSVFTVDESTGVMQLLTKFAVDKITFARS